MEANRYVFATNNQHKIDEVLKILGNNFKIMTLNDIGCKEDIPEDGDTLEANALQKARYIYTQYKTNCFADDTGLEIEALNNRPGVYSARYAGSDKDANANMQKVLSELQHEKNRKARFRTLMALIINGKEYLFEGIVNGKIITEKKGLAGFGYDPIFQPDGFDHTFAEMDLIQKNQISHRAQAINQLVMFLKSIQ